MKKIIFLHLILGVLCSPLFSQLVVTTTTEPNVDADPSYVIYNNTVDTYDNNTRRWHYDTLTPSYDSKHHDIGQTFIPATSFTLDKVIVKLSLLTGFPVNVDACKGSAFHLDIYTFNDNSGYQGPASTVTSQGGNLPSDFDLNNQQYLQIDLQDVSLQAGLVYGFLLKFDTIKAGQCIKIIKSHLWDCFTTGRLLTVGFNDDRSVETFNHHSSDAWNYDLLFWLQSTAGGGGDPAPAVTLVSPASVSNANPLVNCTISGSHFQNGAGVVLSKSGESDIYATSVTVVNSTEINCDFAVGGKTAGLWNVTVQNPDGQDSGSSGNNLFSIIDPGTQQVEVTKLASDPAIDSDMVVYNSVNDKPANDWGWFYHSGSTFSPPHRDIGQIFTSPQAFELDKVYVKISGAVDQTQMTACQSAPFHIAILQFDNHSQNALPTDTLSNQNGVLPAQLTAATDRVLCFDLQNISLLSGKKYGFLLQFDTMRSNQYLPLVKTDMSDYYNGGTYLYVEFDGNAGRQNVSSWTWVHSVPNMKRDINFWIQKATAPVDPAPEITGLSPNTGANTESALAVSISGNHFQNGATVKLSKSGESDITGTSVIFYHAGLITAVFDLTGAAPGVWNAVVENPDNQNSGSSGNSLFSVTAVTPVRVEVTNSAYHGTTIIVDGVEHTAPYETNWLPNSSHTISVDEIQELSSTERYQFNNWSDGKSQTHTVTVVSDTIFIAYMIKQVKPTITLNGTDMDHTVTIEEHHQNALNRPVSYIYGSWSDWCDVGSVLRFSRETSGSQPVRETTDRRQWMVNSPFNATITYVQSGYAVEITTSEGSGSQVIVDGQTYNAPFTATWQHGTRHNIGVPSPQAAGTGKRLLFSQWNNGQPRAHTLTAVSDTTVVADLLTQYIPTVVLNGTDASHTVNLEAHTQNGTSALQSGLYYSWSDWCDAGTELRFGRYTTGSPRKETGDTRSWIVNSAFTTTLHYSTTAPLVSSITPNSGTNTGSVTITNLAGQNFVAGAQVRLVKTGDIDIVATDVTVVSAERITCTFDLSGAAGGNWNVLVINPDNQNSGQSGNQMFFIGTPQYIDVTVTTDVGSGTRVIIDGQEFDAPCQQQWIAGAQHRIAISSPQIALPDKQYLFMEWSDGKALEHYVAPTADTSFIADLLAQYKPTIELNGTDALHTVTTEAHTKNTQSFQVSGHYGTWSDWCDEGTELRFSQKTTGSPVKTTFDNRSWVVNSAFTVTINYIASAPVIDSVSPDSIDAGSGEMTLTLNGSNFQDGASIILKKSGENDILASNVQYVNSNKLVFSLYTSGMAVGEWSIVVSNPDGRQSSLAGENRLHILAPAHVAAKNAFPHEYGLMQNFPNPFNPATTIVYKLDQSEHVRLDIYSVHGEWIRTLIEEEQQPGVYTCTWEGRNRNGRQVANGLYLYGFTTDHWQQSRKMLFLK